MISGLVSAKIIFDSIKADEDVTLDDTCFFTIIKSNDISVKVVI